MAEIKSTMDMVLERAAKMAAAAAPEVENEDLVKTGMRFAADYLNQKEADLAELLGAQAAQDQVSVRKGMVQTLLRNIVLPRDGQLQESGKIALQGVLSLGGESAEIQEICQELTQILEQYGQHKEQTTQQLDDAIRAQLEQQQASQGQEVQQPVNPAMHPQYREELTKMLTSLNNQYNDAMEQRKQMILQRFSTATR
ncbi:MAG: hypothetical protein GY799_29240 [Desulfobulbaceae bacterium]|nr:hypothetical protein [Desulfobulbaceae bacterium]